MKTALTIAGSDSSGGAGIQADIKTMTLNGVFAMSAVTALTAQNTTGVTGISEVSPEFLRLQIDAVFEDIYPDAVKIGMVSSSVLIEVIAERLEYYKAPHEAISALTGILLPMAQLATPNIPEGQILADMEIRSEQDMEKAAAVIYDRYGCAVLLKGGHSVNDANDLLYDEKGPRWFRGKRIDNPNTHGTGCTFSSAIAANLAKGFSLDDSVIRAKDYISGALSAMLDLGSGSGPMDHAFDLDSRFAKEP